ncbi:MAG: NAD(P)/FAD-dependent oxidoreductase [Omnitrophica bacterium]|nr:NAD(P)/FAD-dependent oxidoreductase [Candidatus Omnitrophota bacterium]
MYDLAIIGAGAAGIACAKDALAAKFRVILIEREEKYFGGTCLNTGCIPTKFFLNSSKLGKSWEESFSRVKEIVAKIKQPLLFYLEKQGLDIVWGQASFIDKNTLDVSGRKINAENIVIATGSSPKSILNDKRIIPAEELFNKDTLGDKVLIIGAGYIGMEFASLLHNLGKTVCVAEKEDRILPGFDKQLANRLASILSKKGIDIRTSSDVTEFDRDDYDFILSAVGRKPNIAGLKTENVGLSLQNYGWINTDSFMRTNIENIYACGDVTGKMLLAYVAEYQARICVNNIRGTSTQENYKDIAECVFSLPQIAKVGVLDEEVRKENIRYKVLKSNFLRYSSAYVYDDMDGFIKVVVDEKNKIIGAGIISHSAAELINIFSLCIKNGLGLEELRRCLFIHPTISEIIPSLFLD